MELLCLQVSKGEFTSQILAGYPGDNQALIRISGLTKGFKLDYPREDRKGFWLVESERHEHSTENSNRENTAVFREGMIWRVQNDLSQMVCHSGSELAGILLFQGSMSRHVEAEPAGPKPWMSAESSKCSTIYFARSCGLCVCTHKWVHIHTHVWCSGFGLSVITMNAWFLWHIFKTRRTNKRILSDGQI